MSRSLVSIIILNWNGADCICECLDSVLKTAYKNTEILVVDNGSTDGSQEIIKKFSRIQLVALKENIGFAAGNNVGFKNAKGKFIATLNNDVVVESDWLNEPVSFFEGDDSLGIVSCRQMNYYQHDIIDCLYGYPLQSLLIQPMGNSKKYSSLPLYSQPGYVLSAGGASAIYRKEMVVALDGFDERYYAYHEESDLCMRAFLSGWKCKYAPSAVVYHRGSFSFNRVKKRYAFYHERNRIWFIYKFYPLKTIAIHFVWLMIMNLRLIRVWVFKRKVGITLFSAWFHGFLEMFIMSKDRKIYTKKFMERHLEFKQFLREKKIFFSSGKSR
jgi:GT2 family glycosyltransferase